MTRSRVQTLSEKAMKAITVKKTIMKRAAACLGGVGMAEISGVAGTAMAAVTEDDVAPPLRTLGREKGG